MDGVFNESLVTGSRGILHGKARVAHERDQVDKGLGTLPLHDGTDEYSHAGQVTSREAAALN